MWKLLKAEFSYNRYWLLVNYLVFILFLVLFVVMSLTSFSKGKSWHIKPLHVPMMMVASSVFSTVLMLFRKTADKRDYFHMKLPVSPLVVGTSRVLFAVCVWVSLAILFWLVATLILPQSASRPKLCIST